MFHYLYKEFGGLHQAAFVLGLSALLSQILALLRDRLLASNFGASVPLDVYYAAFRIPDLIYVSFASFVSVTVLIPLLIDKAEKSGQESVKDFLNSVLTVFCLMMVLVSVIFFFLMPYLVPVVGPGFAEPERESLLLLSRILLLSPFLLGLSNLFGSVTQAFRRFFAYSLSPLLYNAGIIFGILFLLPRFGLPGIVWGVVLGALLHFLIQWPGVVTSGVIPKLTLNIDWLAIKKVILISLPRTITLSSHQLAILALVAIGSFLSTGSITVFNFAFNLQSVPLMIIGVSYSVAAFPTLAKLFTGGHSEKFLNQVSVSVRHILFWSLPAIGLFIVLRAQIVRVILGTGEFSWNDTSLTAAVLALFVVSVWAQSLINLLVRGYYAGGKTRVPLVVNSLSSLFSIVLALVLLRLFEMSLHFRFFMETLFRVEGILGTEVLMLPLAFSGGVFVNIFFLWFLFERDFGRLSIDVGPTFFHSFATAVFSGFVAYLGLTIWADIFDMNTFLGIFLQGLLAGIFGIVSGFLLLVSLDNRELKEFLDSFRSRFGRVKPIMPEVEEL